MALEAGVHSEAPLVTAGMWTLALLATAVALLLVLFRRIPGRLPPGPWGLPVVGAVPFWRGPESNLEWRLRFGPIYSFKAGPELVVYLDKIDLVKKYLEERGESFIARPEGPAAIANGVLFGSGEKWRLNRRLISNALWQGPNMATKLEGVISPLMERLLATLNVSTLLAPPVQGQTSMTVVKVTGGPQGAFVGELFIPFATNLLSTLIRGESFPPEDPELAKMASLLEEVGRVDLTSMKTMLSLKKPGLKSILDPGSPNLYELSAQIQAIIRGWVSSHQEARLKGQGQTGVRGCIDEFLDSSEYNQINSDDKEQIQSLMDVYFGGVSALLSAVEFTFLYLLHHPQVAARVQEEVRGLTWGSRDVCWGDRTQLPYCQAVLLEVHRLAAITPSCLPHVTTQECQVEGYTLPPGTHVKTCHFVLHRDPDHFPDPEVFKPERHLDAEGKVKVPDSFRPYGCGPRLCPGELLSDITLFLTLTNVMQRYDVTTVGSALPPFVTSMRVVRRLAPYRVVFKPRA